MKAPVCRVCDHAHWASEPHVLKGEPVRQEDLTVRQSVLQPVRQQLLQCCEHLKRIAELEAELARLKREPFDKKTYQREYMRRRRARQKG